MSDDSGWSDAKRRLPTSTGSVDKRARSHHGSYRRIQSRSHERVDSDYLDAGDLDDGPSTSSSSSKRHFPFSNTSANSSENDEMSRQRHRRISPRLPASMSGNADSTANDYTPPVGRFWSDNGRQVERTPHPGPADMDGRMGMSIERMPSPPGLTLSSGQPIVGPPLKTQAAFVGKLYSMLEDDEIKRTGLLHWSNNGATFICPNPTEFSKAILPRYFKHNNWQSFVRQLNMYSFNKVNDLYATSSDPAAWEFRHPLFRQGEPHFLASIKRKTTRNHVHDGLPMLSPTEEFGDSRMLGMPHGYGSATPGISHAPTAAVTASHTAPWTRDSYPPPSATAHPPYGDPRDPRDSRDLRDTRDSRTSVQSGQVFGIDLKTGKTIESRPYEQTARASTREYFERVRPGSASGPTHESHARSATVPGHGERYYHDRGYTSDQLPPPLSAPPRGRGRDAVPREREGPPNTAGYPQPSSIPLSSSMVSPSGAPGPYGSEIAYLQDKVARLNDGIAEQCMEGLRREMEAVSYSLSLIDWLPNAPPLEIRNVQQGLNQRVSDLRREYETIANRASAYIEPSRSDRTRHAPASTATSQRGSQMTEPSTHRSSTATQPATPLIAHTPLSHTRGSVAPAPPGTASSSMSMSNGILPPPSAGPSPASRKLPLPTPSLDMRGLPSFHNYSRESVTSPLAFEYIPSAQDGMERPVLKREMEPRREIERVDGREAQYGSEERGRAEDRHRPRHEQSRDRGGDQDRWKAQRESLSRLPASPREAVRPDSPVSPKTTARPRDIERFEDRPEQPPSSAHPVSPGSHSAGSASQSPEKRRSGDTTRSNGAMSDSSPSHVREAARRERSSHGSQASADSDRGGPSTATENGQGTPSKGGPSGMRNILN